MEGTVMVWRAAALAIAIDLASGVAGAQSGAGEAGETLGTVVFPTSCTTGAQAEFTRAVTLLHSFEFAAAIGGFERARAADAQCAMAYWGLALSRWGNPFAAGLKPSAQLRLGREAVERGRNLGAGTERERGYIEAVSRLYDGFETVGQPARMRAYRDAMGELALTHPDDTEASVFYALALAAAAPPTDKTYADLLRAGAILDRIALAQPDHPGLAHYVIHSYDVPPLAGRALAAARRYAKIAPAAPHALHMPSHTFTRLGLWQESIDTNIASADTARRAGAVGEELHAMDYQVYAYLQSGQDEAARRLVESLPEVASRLDPHAIGSAAPPMAGPFALASIPARYALERGAWAEAAKLEPRPSEFPNTDAMTWFARALGAARSGDVPSARKAIEALESLRDRLAKAGESYWAGQVEIQVRGASAWLALAERRRVTALTELRAAVAAEDATEKNAITPGPLAPGHELLGEMLLQVGQPARALVQFEATLRTEPNRFRALYGAAHAASLAGQRAAARRYYARLVDTCARGDNPGRAELREARAALAR